MRYTLMGYRALDELLLS